MSESKGAFRIHGYRRGHNPDGVDIPGPAVMLAVGQADETNLDTLIIDDPQHYAELIADMIDAGVEAFGRTAVKDVLSQVFDQRSKDEIRRN